MIAQIITIGTEILDGSRVNANAAYLGRKLTLLGVDVVRVVSVSDDSRAIGDELSFAIAGADLVIATGGLGPASDDRTKHVVARVFGRKLRLDEDVLGELRSAHERQGREMPESVVSRAMIPEGARPIHNRRGTAPGLLLEGDDVLLFALPGAHREMRDMAETFVLPFLEGRGVRRRAEERLVRTTGLSEDEVRERIAPLAKKLARTDVAYVSSEGGVDLKIVGRGEGPSDAGRAADRAVVKLTDKLGPYVYASGEQSLEKVVGYLLSMASESVAVAESCTGGRIGWRLTRIVGSSEYFVGGVIAYSNDLKRRLLGVKAKTLSKRGAVSAEVAAEMAEGVRRKCDAGYGVAVTGIAGPGGGEQGKPVGLVFVSVSKEGACVTREFHFVGSRGAVREQASQAALELLRRVLLGIDRK